MSNISTFTATALILSAAVSFNALANTIDKSIISTENQKISYSIGVKSAEEFSNLELDLDSYLQGYKDFVSKNKLQLTEQEMNQALTTFQNNYRAKQEKMTTELQQKKTELAMKNLAEAEKFLQTNATKKNVIVLTEGIQYEVIKANEGVKPKLGDTVVVNYIGKLMDGTEFDNSYLRNESVSFELAKDSLIAGWIELIPHMSEGSQVKAYIHPKFAYGSEGIENVIAPNALLIFEIELVKVQPKA